MSREIKFRFWDNLKKQFIKGKRFHLTEDNSFLQHKLGFTLSQYTGLKDKNGKEIYEGDILRDGNGFLYEVYWLDTSASFELEEKQELPDDYDIPTFNFRNSFRLEIVSNIFENQKI